MFARRDQLAEGLDAGDHAGDYIATTEHLTMDLYGGVPGGAGEFAEQTPVVATVNS